MPPARLRACVDFIRSRSTDSVDSILTDPPYGLSDHKPGEAEVWQAAFTVLKPGGHTQVFADTRSMDLICMALRLPGSSCAMRLGTSSRRRGAL